MWGLLETIVVKREYPGGICCSVRGQKTLSGGGFSRVATGNPELLLTCDLKSRCSKRVGQPDEISWVIPRQDKPCFTGRYCGPIARGPSWGLCWPKNLAAHRFLSAGPTSHNEEAMASRVCWLLDVPETKSDYHNSCGGVVSDHKTH